MHKKNKQNNITETIIDTLKNTNNTNIVSDYDGSYTGVPVDNYFEIPVQDADDL